MARKVMLYAISTCGWCKRAKDFLDGCGVAYEVQHVDLLTGEERERVREQVRQHNPRLSYPTVVVDDTEVIVGYDEGRMREVLGL